MAEFNVKDYGAKGDGVTDDTEAIKHARDAAGWTRPEKLYDFPSSRFAGFPGTWVGADEYESLKGHLDSWQDRCRLAEDHLDTLRAAVIKWADTPLPGRDAEPWENKSYRDLEGRMVEIARGEVITAVPASPPTDPQTKGQNLDS